MKKKVTAPLSYDPGKGRPKEHLAYLNWQEMQQLQRLNGGNMERGPRGLPSFPPADAKGSSSRSSSSPSRSSGGGGRDSGQAASRSSGSYGGGGRDTGGRGNVGMGKAPSSSRASSGSYGGGGRDTGGKGNVGMGRAPSAAKSSGYGGGGRDMGRAAPKPSSTIKSSVAPSGVRSIPTVSRVPGIRTPSESQISGVLSRVPSRTTQPRDEQGPISSKISPEGYGWAATGPSRLAAYQAQRIYGRDLAMAGEKFSQKEFDTLLNSNTISDPQLNAQVNSLPKEMRKNAAILSSAAKMYGIDPRVAIGMGAAETNLGALKDRKGSQYQGLLQMGGAAWSEAADEKSKALGKKNPWASSQAGMAYLAQNKDRFTARFGREPTMQDMYGMHQQGPGGYMKLVGNPGTPAYKIVGYDAVIQNLPKSMRNAKTAKNITSEQFANVITKYPEKKLASLSGGVPVAASAPPAKQPNGFSLTAALAPLAVKTIYRDRAQDLADQATGYIKQGYDWTREKLGYGETQPSGVSTGYPGVQPASSESSVASVAPSQIGGAEFQPYGMTVEQQKEFDKYGNRVQRTAQAGSVVTAPLGFGLGFGLRMAGSAINKAAEAKVNKYVASTPAERAEQERKDPSLIGWARAIGVQPQNDYSVYQAWAQERGLRSPEESRGNQQDVQYAGGIGALPSASTPVGTSEQTGSRPYEYYQWDVGVNIPSPGDPNYTSYQEYLRRRAQAQA